MAASTGESSQAVASAPPPPVIGQDKSVVFQALAWHAEDVDYSLPEHGGDGLAPGDPEDMRYTIKVFGRTQTGASVSATIAGFTPYFYVKVGDGWTKQQVDRFGEHIRSKLPYRTRPALLFARSVWLKDFWGFTNNKESQFVRLTFQSHKAMRSALRTLTMAQTIPTVTNGATMFKVYEANIDPYIRFMHIRNVQPCGWLKLQRVLTSTSILQSTSATDVEVSWQNVHPHACDDTAPFTIASFDIECTSSSGEFPVARKDFRSLAGQLYDMYAALKKEGANEYRLRESVQAGLLYGFGAKDAAPVPGIHRNDTMEEVDQAHLSEATNTIWDDVVTILSGKKQEGTGKPTRDKVVTTLTALLSKDSLRLPRFCGDPIIQIGTTVHAYGQRECSYKHIITLGTCDPVEGAVVESCESEVELLLKWRDLIVRLDPDILTGYNIFGFDFAYMYERARELNVASAFMKLSRLAGRTCEFKENKLSSSALGDNILKFINTEGRVQVDLMKVVQRDHKLDSYKLDLVANHFIGLNKNDVSPQEIFRLQRGSAADRARIAAYCVQDCQLCNLLAIKLEIVANNMGMANVCLVPLSFIFMRGQGIKIFSLVLKQAKEEGFVIPVVRPPPDKVPGSEEPDPATTEEEGYEGAIVLEPQAGIYIDDPVSVLDYASLYPSSMISENLSHDCLVMDPKYDNLPGVEYLDITYDVYDENKVKQEPKVCRFAQLPEGKKGVIPNILNKLLKARKTTRKRATLQVSTLLATGQEVRGYWKDDQEQELVSEDGATTWPVDQLADVADAFNDFQKAVLDGLQLAYKVTANSLYGQIGARTSPIYLKDIAACTTATGRKMILMAKAFLEQECGARVVYGDTDSVFCIMPREPGVSGHAAIAPSIQKAIDASSIFKKRIKRPHDLEYEKTFWPFILLSKKRYVGNKYEFSDQKFKQNSMGIVLKRRDNANIVKKVYGGIIDRILNSQDVPGSVDFLKASLQDLVNGKCDMEDLVVTKALRSDYKDPTRIAHKVLAERIGERTPGAKPQSSDRIPFIYVKTPAPAKGEAKLLQGERIETPNFIKENNLAIDYNHYITNQIMRPVQQLYAIVVEQLPEFKTSRPHDYFKTVLRNIEVQPELDGDEKRIKEKLSAVKEAVVKELLFDPFLRQIEDAKVSKSMLTRKFFPEEKPKPAPKKKATASTAATVLPAPGGSVGMDDAASVASAAASTSTSTSSASVKQSKARAPRKKAVKEEGDSTAEPTEKKPRARKPQAAAATVTDADGSTTAVAPSEKKARAPRKPKAAVTATPLITAFTTPLAAAPAASMTQAT